MGFPVRPVGGLKRAQAATQYGTGASVGDSPSDRFEWTPGPTGFGARALLHWLGSDDPTGDVS